MLSISPIKIIGSFDVGLSVMQQSCACIRRAYSDARGHAEITYFGNERSYAVTKYLSTKQYWIADGKK